jgi:hypothetical protein
MMDFKNLRTIQILNQVNSELTKLKERINTGVGRKVARATVEKLIETITSCKELLGEYNSENITEEGFELVQDQYEIVQKPSVIVLESDQKVTH